jgi:3-methyladenine DNA glycosylase AlkD
MQEAVQHWLDGLQGAFIEAGDPVRATGEKAYLKSDLEFIGTGVPFIRSTAKRFGRAFPSLAHADLVEVVEALWQPPIHELRSLAIAILEVYRDRLVPADLALIETILRQCKTWAHVDWLAVKVAGPLIDRSPDGGTVLERWSRDPWMWLRRSALLAHLETLRAGGGDFEDFERLAVGMLDEKEFFIRKAIGWILRDVSRKRPELAYRFLDTHLAEVSGLTLREGARHLPEQQRDALLERYERRGANKRAKA